MAEDIREPYLTFAGGVQALRRRSEALSWGLSGALGIAADPYPHQIGTVNRILSDIRIRHLIADEVGLGKTIQALMIINALRFQDPEHRTVVLAPERLIGQWQAELWSRGHIQAAVVGSEDTERAEDPPVLLVRPRDVQNIPGLLDPKAQSLLIVDEPQSIPLEAMQRVAAACSGLSRNDGLRYRQVLVLSATPRLADPRWRDIIFEILEPERFGLASAEHRSISEYLDTLEKDSCQNLVGLTSEELQIRGDFAFKASAVTRRISRQTRKAWGDFLPRRLNQEIKFEPTGTEIARLKLINTILARHPANDMAVNPWPNIRAMLRSRRSTRAAIDTLNASVENSDVAAVRQLTIEDPGDSRLDALLDILSSRWQDSPDEKFIIVAGDARTIDMLSSVLPQYLPDLSEGAISSLKRPPAATEETALDIQEMYEAVEPFTSGGARLLLIGDWVQAGLNLHHTAENIIFYSLPWDPQAVDQLIGRIDRLRHRGLFNATKGRSSGTVKIWRLIMRNSPEEAISAGMDAIRIFERPLPQIPEEDTSTLDTIFASLARGGSLPKYLHELKAMTDGWDARGLQTRLEMFDPTRPECIKSVAGEFIHAKRIEPSMGIPSHGSSVVEQAELANKAWMDIIEASQLFSVGGKKDRRDHKYFVKTFWYQKGQVGMPFPLSDIGTDNWWTDHAAFIMQRSQLSSPPRKTVVTDDGQKVGRLLRFFDHGEGFHDDLVRGFISLCESEFSAHESHREFRVRLADGHPALKFASRPLLVSVGYHEPSRSLDWESVPEVLSGLVQEASTEAQRSRLHADLLEFQADLQADQRWLGRLLQPILIVKASEENGEGWQQLDRNAAALLLKPMGEDGKYKPIPKTIAQSAIQGDVQVRRGVQKMHSLAITDDIRKATKGHLKLSVQAARARLNLIASEMSDLENLRLNQLNNWKDREVSETQRDMFRGQVTALENRHRFVQAASLERAKRIQSALINAEKCRPNHVWHAFFRFVPISQ